MTYNDFVELNNRAKESTKNKITFRSRSDSKKDMSYFITLNDEYRATSVRLEQIIQLIEQGKYYVSNPAFVKNIRFFDNNKPKIDALTLHEYSLVKSRFAEKQGFVYCPITVKDTGKLYKSLDGKYTFRKDAIDEVFIDRYSTDNGLRLVLLEKDDQHARTKLMERQKEIIAKLEKELASEQNFLNMLM